MAATTAITGSGVIIDICSCDKEYTEADIKAAPGVKRVQGGGTDAYYWWNCHGGQDQRGDPCKSLRCAIERDGRLMPQPSVTMRMASSIDASGAAHFHVARIALEKPSTMEADKTFIETLCDRAKARSAQTEIATLKTIGLGGKRLEDV
jgi:hypothetical protein